MSMAFSSMKAKYRSTHIFLSGSGPNSYKRVIFSLVVVEELDFFFVQNKKINNQIKASTDAPTEDIWGVQIQRFSKSLGKLP